MVDALVWWVVLQVLGLAVLPVGAVLFRALPDRGYALSKPLGLLLVGWLGYVLAMVLGLPFNRVFLILCIVLVVAFSAWLAMRNDRALWRDMVAHYSRPSWIRYVVTAEVLFALAFAAWAVVRAYNPNIVDQEKFMDFGFLNSILKSERFPPNDMWLAGFSINYYYFGYVLVAAVTALSGVPTEVAFNLANVTMFSITALGAFGLVYGLVASRLLIRPSALRGARREAVPVEAVVPEPEPDRQAVAAGLPRRRARTAEVVAPVQAPEPVESVEEPPVPRRSRSKRAVEPESEVVPETGGTVVATLPRRRRRPAVEEPVEAPVEPAPDGHAVSEPSERAERVPEGPPYLPAHESSDSPRRVPWFLSPYIYAVAAALMVVAMGNLTTMFATKAARGSDPGTLEGNGFRFCFACNSGPSYDWFAPSRIIQDYRTTQVPGQPASKEKVGFETINEFPAFSFLLADMHPHVLALPLVMLAIGTGFALARRRVLRAGSWRDGIPPGVEGWASIVVAGIIAGSLYTANTWDYPTYLLVMLLCLAVPYVAVRQRAGGWRWLAPLAVQGVLLVVLSLLVYLPFHLTFKSLVGGEEVAIPENLANIPIVGWLLSRLGQLVLINNADKTILGFVVIFGIFLFALLGWLVYEFVTYQRRRDAANDSRNGTYLWLGFFGLVLVLALLLRFPLFGLLLPVVAVSAAMVWNEPRRVERNVALVLVGLAALIGLAIEIVFLRDNFQMRMNTLFKFYFQIWVMWAIAAGYAVWRVLYAAYGAAERGEVRARERAAAPSSMGGLMKGVSAVWAVAFALLVVSGLMYTVYGVQSRQIGGRSAPRGLDGAVWVRDEVPGDYDAVNWLKANAAGSDYIMEAGRDEYSRPGRVSAYSGIPTLVAWDTSHEMLWRTNQQEALRQIAERRNIVNSLYQGVDPEGAAPITAERALELLNRYGVRYVVAGATERGQAGWGPSNPGEQMTEYAEGVFKQAMKVAFTSGTTVLYEVGDTIAGTGQAPPPPAAATPTPGGPAIVPTTDPNATPVALFTRSSVGVNPGQWNLPRGIARDAEGNFYVVDTANFRVQKFDPEGTYILSFGSKGNGDGQFNPYSDEAIGSGPGGVAVDAQGNVYVADTWNHRIQKFDSNGKFLLKWGEFINLADPVSVATGGADVKFFGPRGVAIGPDGNVYVTDTGNKRVMVFTPDGQPVGEIGSQVTPEKTSSGYAYSGPNEFNEPVGIAADGAGNVYVADTNNKRIQKIGPDAQEIMKWPVPAGMWDPVPYNEPFLAADGAGNVYATAPSGRTVLKFGPDGQVVGQKADGGSGVMARPTGIWADADGTVYVVDTEGNSIVRLGQVP
jgi:YYY domain-containing protein